MFENRPDQRPQVPIADARIELQPSDDLRELIRPFYRDEAAHKLAHLSLKSAISIPLELRAGQHYTYRDPRTPDQNSTFQFAAFERNNLARVAGHQHPLLAHAQLLRNKKGGIRIELQAATTQEDRTQLGALHDFAEIESTGIIRMQHDIMAHNVTDEASQRLAMISLMRAIGMGHPARRAVPAQKRFVDPARQFVTSDAHMKVSPRLRLVE